jgi:ABC transporter fused permease/ATP-binding protein
MLTNPHGSEIGRTRRMLQMALSEWPTLAIGTVFLLLSSASGLVFPQAVRIFMDEIASGGGRELINKAAIAMAVVFLVQGAASGLRYYLFTVAGERIVMRLREQLYERIVSQEIAFFDQRRTGELTSRLLSDTSVLQSAVSVNISMGLRNVVGAVGGVALLAYTSAKLTLLMLVVVPPIAIGAVWFGREVRRFSRAVSDAVAASSNVAEESISGVRTVRLFAREKQETARYGAAIANAFSISQRRIRITGIFQAAVTTLGSGALVAVLWYGGRLVLDNVMTVGELTAFLLYTTGVAMSLGTLASLWSDFMSAAGAGDRVFDLLDRSASIPLHGGTTLTSVSGHVAFEGVHFTYPSRPDISVLKGIDLEIPAGEMVALVGPSGGGKSTIAGLIPRLYDPNGGRITIDGHNLRDLDPSSLREHIATVSQEPTLFSTTIYENIAYGAGSVTPTVGDVEAAARAANAHDFIMSFPEGYQTTVGERGVQLSGGQKQRIAIARAVLRNPAILILDEATSALDAESEHLVQEALERLTKRRTTLVIAHRLSTVVGADRVVVIDGGRIVQSGPHDVLMRSSDGLYRKLVERQFVQLR